MLTFIDFFAGVGGFTKGMKLAGHKPVGWCEWDKFARLSYEAIHKPGDDEWNGTDIRNVRADELPKADVWTFGFPCQDISIAGKQLGFRGKRSSLFFAITNLIRETPEENRPKYLIIENVKNFLSVNDGYDFLQAQIELDEIGYETEWQVLNSKHFGVPQNRERVYIVGHLRGKSTRKVFPIEPTMDCKNPSVALTARGYGRQRNGTYVITNSYRKIACLTEERTDEAKQIRKKMSSKGIDYSPRRFKELKLRNDSISNCLTANKTIEHLIYDGNRIRFLTPLEWFRLQGWPDEDFYKAKAVNSDSQLYKQAGNGVTVNVVYEIAKRLE